MDLNRQVLSDVVVFSKYAKYVPEVKRRETWDELVTRNMDMHIQKFPALEDQIRSAYRFVYEKRVLPSMRSLQFGGRPIELNPSRIFNCSYMAFDDVAAFSELMFLLLGGTGVGYALSLDTPIITPSGWTTMAQLQIGGYVFGSDGKPTKITDISPVHLNHKIYEIEFSNGEIIKADANHLWTIQTRGQRNRTGTRTKTVSTEQLKAQDSIFLAAPLEFPEIRSLLLDPYVLGYWLGDGHTKNAIISTGDQFIIDELERLGHTSKSLRRYDYYVYGLHHGLSKLGLLKKTGGYKENPRIVIGSKTIPQEYMFASYDNRLALLQGLMDSDGCCSKRGQCTFSVKLESLAKQTLELVTSLGIKATLKQRKTKSYPMYSVSFTTNVPVFRLPRKLERLGSKSSKLNKIYISAIREIETEPVKCIMVEAADHLYLAGKQLVPTHNSVQKHHVAKLPPVRKPLKNRRFVVGDSIEGWADAVKVLIRAYLGNGSLPRFDFSDIRRKGARLVTSGGKAPGPEPLKECLFHIQKMLDRKQDGEHLTPLECHDIACHIADAVLAGGIRRAAMIALFSLDDEEMLGCKVGKWYEENPQRGRANNSVVLLRNRIKEKDFQWLWERIEAGGTGEPGIYFTNDREWGANPCVEIALRIMQFCVAGNTKLITRTGIETIQDSVGREIEVWNGQTWSKVRPFQTGTADRLHRVHLSDGSFLDATDNHKFLVKNRFQKDFYEVETLQLIKLLKDSKYSLQVPRTNISADGGAKKEYSYDLGFVLGDGCVYQGQVTAGLFGKDKQLHFATTRIVSSLVNSNGTPFTQVEFALDSEYCAALKYNYGLPKDVFTWDRNSALEFIAGWLDADGTQASNGVRLYGRQDKLIDAQLLLTKHGYYSSLNLMQSAGVKTNLGYRRNAVWYLQITQCAGLPTKRLKCIHESLSDKNKFQIIKRIETLPGLHPTFCVSESQLHQCVFNNILTKQCNLTEINVSDIIDQADLEARAVAAAFIGTLQASYTDFHYLREEWKQTTEKEALLGIGMTGIASGKVMSLDLTHAAELTVQENRRVAKLIGINPAARVTCTKPSGTTSLVLGCSSGVHAWHNDYYLRRMKIGKNEALYQYLNWVLPDTLEDDYFRPDLMAHVVVPIKAPEGAILRHESPIETLERVKYLYQNWIAPGHNKGQNTHNVSCTINVKPDQWGEVGRWMWINREYYAGIAVMPFDGGNYKNLPFEDCDQATYDRLTEQLAQIDLTAVEEGDDNTTLIDQVACGGGACSLV